MAEIASKKKGLFWLTASILLAAMVVSPLHSIPRMIPWSWEHKLASLLPPNAHRDQNLTHKQKALLHDMVARIYPIYPDDKAIPLTITVSSDPIVNAYATLGGHIYINAGLIKQAKSPEEVAGVIAHEIEHIKQRHILAGILHKALTIVGMNMIFSGSSEAYANLSSTIINLKFSRRDETAADLGALKRLQAAHVSTKGMQDFFKRQKENNHFLSSHPSDEDRFAMAKKFSVDDAKPLMGSQQWRDFIDSLSAA